MLPLFMFLFELSPHYVRAQVTAPTGSFALVAAAYERAIGVYSQGAAYVAGTLAKASVLAAFPAFVISITTEDTYLVVGMSAATSQRLLVQRAGELASAAVAQGMV